ncbi:MAG: ATP synthase F1 subunit gamma [Candidatus Omnitrophica bacterium]|nr:ATP synthase F1 subunit gamma [Candidatus Omnitrophota bacterium]
MSSLRQIRRRIRSVENTKKMTRAMEMVAASKLKKLQDLLRQSDRYIAELGRILQTLVREKPLAHPLLEKRLEPKSTLAFLIASDTGLCGSYNTNIIERTNRFILSSTKSIHFIAIGKQGATYLKRAKQTVSNELSIPRPQEIDQTIREITQIAKDQFTSGEADQVIFIYTKVISLGSLKPTVEQLFPITSTTAVPGTAGTGSADSVNLSRNVPGTVNQSRNLSRPEPVPQEVDYIIEPSLDSVLDIMLPEFIEAEIGQFVKHSLVAEQASRMMAMRQATDNAKEMIDSLTLLRNKARQASITKELIEVVSGSRALQAK